MTGKFSFVSLFTNQVLKYFGFLMVIVYIAIGLLFIFWSDFFSDLNRNARYLIGCILVIYGLFRAYRIVKDLRHDNAA
jgi:cytochrome c biogenesis protein CcdA